MKSLSNFPEDFQPLVVVTGDRREVPPRSKGDVLAYSVSSTDVMYLIQLGLIPVQGAPENGLVVSDKQFVVDPEETLAKRFGATNLLVLGSPAVNLLARRINEESRFRFAISEETQLELEEQDRFMSDFIQSDEDLFVYHQCLEGTFDLDVMLARFVELALNIETLRENAHRIVQGFRQTMICRDLTNNPRPFRYLMHKLDQPGIFDSYSQTVRGKSLGANKDYGLISVLPNPFSQNEKFHIIYVGGVHGPATAAGVRILKSKHAFADHPYGGVYDMDINRFANYFEKIQRSNAKWETRGFKESDPIPVPAPARTLQIFLSSPGKEEDIQQKEFNNEIQRLLDTICGGKGIQLQFEHPYHIALGGGDDFWQKILSYEKSCNFILHDITDCALGVMVEIGFSYGSKKAHFLIWNVAKRPVAKWSEVRLPQLLPVHQIEKIDWGKGSETLRVLQEKIVDPFIAKESVFDFEGGTPIEKRRNRKGAFIYASEPTLREYLEKELRRRRITPVGENEGKHDLRIRKISQVLEVADYAIIQIDDNDLDSYIILGMAKAIGVNTLPLRLDRYTDIEFAWGRESVKFSLGGLEQQLPTKLAEFLHS